jgi:PAS domain S-box-containing protein
LKTKGGVLDLLDDGLDELAASAHAGFLPRIATTTLVAAVAAFMIAWRSALVWFLCTFFLELLAWPATRRQFLGEKVGRRTRLAHITLLAVTTLVWTVLGALLWTGGGIEGLVCAALIWISVIYFAQTNGYQSRSGVLFGGVLPGLAVILMVVFLHPGAPVRIVPVTAVLIIAYGFAMDGVMRALATRRRLLQAQEETRLSEMRYRTLTEASTDVIVRYNVDGIIEFVSPSVRRLGYEPEAVIGKYIYDFGHPDERKSHVIDRRTMVEQDVRGGDWRRQFRSRRADGSYIWVESNPSILRDANGEITGFVAIQRDITERREIEAELHRKTEEAEAAVHQAERANAAKSDFLAVMSHESRTPLNGVLGMAQAMERDRLSAVQAERLKVIISSGASLLTLLNDILDLSKIEAGMIELSAARFNLSDIAAELDTAYGAIAREKGVGLKITLSPDALGVYEGDQARIRQILSNLVSNALKVTEAGDVEVSIRREGEQLTFSVSDSGIGISEDSLPRLFEKFVQADSSTTRRFGGTGLGLAISRQLAEAMGGTLKAQSRVGEGSAFTLSLPLVRFGAEERRPEEAAASGPEAAFGRLRVLVAEDNPTNQMVLKTLLAQMDIDLVMVANGVEAIAAVKSDGVFDAILMDIQMPEMDGVAATREIRRLETLAEADPIPIIALTANAMRHQIEFYRSEGMDDHVSKPINLAELVAALERACHGRQTGKAASRASS